MSIDAELKKVDLVLFAGQSNMAGRGITSEKWPEVAPKVTEGAGYEYRAISEPDKLCIMEEPFGVNENNPNGIYDVFSGEIKAKTGSLVSAFTNAYFAMTGRSVVGVSASKGGSTLSQWQPDAKDNFLNDAIDRLEAARKWLIRNGYEIDHCFSVWSQGESDGDAGTSESEYIKLFSNFLSVLSEHVSDVFMIKTGKCNIPGQDTRYDTVRLAQEKIDSIFENVHICARTFGFLKAEGLMKDAFHYFQKGYNLCGEAAGRNVGAYILEKDRIKAPFNWKLAVSEDFPHREIIVTELKDTNNKKFIQKAIESCHAAGGGRVTVPAGVWQSGPIRLYDNIELHLEKDAVISFSDIPEDYLPVVFTRWEGIECYNYSPLIYARDCVNIAVTGEGKLQGNGENWWPWKKLQQKAATELVYSESNGIPVDKRQYGTKEAALRPSFIQFINCKNVCLSDFEITDGPQWTVHPVYCENVLANDLRINTCGHNTDGFNPDSCRNVLIEGCSFSTGDDCLAVNSGMNEDGWRVNKPCENVVINDCLMTGGHGGVVIGSGMSGGVRNVYAHGCKISNVMQALRIKSMRGRGGYVEDVLFEDMLVTNISEEAIQVSMFYPYTTVEPKSPVAPKFKNITIRRVSGDCAGPASVVRGLEDSIIENLTLKDIDIGSDKENIEEFCKYPLKSLKNSTALSPFLEGL